MESFLSANPTEIVTIIIEDYVHAPMGLSKLFTSADLVKYWYPVSEMPTNGKDWPSVTDMVAKNRRLLVFTSDASKEASEGIAYQWKYLLENERKFSKSSCLLYLIIMLFCHHVILLVNLPLTSPNSLRQ